MKIVPAQRLTLQKLPSKACFFQGPEKPVEIDKPSFDLAAPTVPQVPSAARFNSLIELYRPT